eukprot:scaffold315176_cov32-Tisochrysis_lutea.AAC.5
MPRGIAVLGTIHNGSAANVRGAGVSTCRWRSHLTLNFKVANGNRGWRRLGCAVDVLIRW